MIDYMQDEMNEASRELGHSMLGDPPEPFRAGWRAALEAAHARAEAKATHDKKAHPSMWPATESAKEQDGKYWAVPKDNGYYVVHTYCALFYKLDGTVWDSSLGSMRKAIAFWGAVACTTEAEARRVAGFGEETQ